ncbi:unannotated protein [freshwater metagenome]|jgi:hypothetical protein|uniref:Unannotated protein n=1 Tax=freshwater metagenome TaxID=449393 RepID=A0A6J6EIA4_9ZZZZ
MIYHSDMINKDAAIKQLGNLFLRGGNASLGEQYARSWAAAAQLRAQLPGAGIDQLCQRASIKYLSLVTATGAITGAVAAAPYFGTISTIGSTASDLYIFGRTSVNHVLLLAALHDLELTDPELRRLTVLSSLLNEQVPTRSLIESKSYIENMNQRLAERVAIKVGAKLLPMRAGAALPLLIGAATAASLNAKLAKQISSNALTVIKLQAV